MRSASSPAEPADLPSVTNRLATPEAGRSKSEESFADVLIPRHLRRAFTYRIPTHLRERLAVGSRVVVPFGPSTVQGVVVTVSATRLPSKHPAFHQMKDILALVDGEPGSAAPSDLMELTRRVADYYLAPWGQCLRLALPASTVSRRPPRYGITDAGRTMIDASKPAARLSATARELLARLAATPRRKGLTLTTLRRDMAGPVARTLTTLEQRGLVREADSEDDRPARRATRRSSPQALPSSGQEPSALPPVPPRWGERISSAFANEGSRTLLLHAPWLDRLTGYLHAGQEALTRGRTVLVIAPDIAHAAAMAGAARTRWGNRVEMFHSGLAPVERQAVWRRIQVGEASVVVGTRSAVFAPLPSLGLICVDQEDHPSLKEEQEPRYHARDVARLRATQHHALFLLGSAHPSLEAWQAMTDGTKPDSLLSLALDRTTPDKPPIISVIDLRHMPYGTVLSPSMLDGIKAALEARAGVILFLNRKGFASALLCRDCGHALPCPHCSVSLTYYRQSATLACRYCGTSAPPPDICPTCQGARLEPVGSGTERVEDMLRRLVPQASIARLDRDQAKTQRQADLVRAEAGAGKWDILIGTQMLLQGLPLPPVGFVGIVNADAGLHAADFRAAERTYHALLDAAALAKSADEGGRVLIQTSLPSHHAITAVAQQNPSLFYEPELLSRQALGYPPFTHLISLQVSGTQAGAVKQAAMRWAKLLHHAMPAIPNPTPGAAESVTILGPVPAQHAQLRGRHRYQLLVKAVSAETARQAVKGTLDDMERQRGKDRLRFDVDVDPLEMT